MMPSSVTPEMVLKAVLARRSCVRLTEPGPTRVELEALVQAAATAPDHGRLRPWRLIPVTGHERGRLGDVLGEAAATPQQAQRAAVNVLRAPMLLSIVLCPVPDHPTVPEWEQLAATAAMVTTLTLLLDSRGWSSIWRTGPAVEAPQVRKHLGIGDEEKLLGWLYTGTRPSTETVRERRPLDVSTKINWAYAPPVGP
ncbi:nitroreductase [Streptomyces sp. NPDC001668]|uniref:nitroreductase family protein n=1 Tax=Streptomyces sp. NPDC001668 TaxID=3364598 RepID=UPI0036A72F61